MLALKYADGGYNDDVFFKKDGSLLDGGPQARLDGIRMNDPFNDDDNRTAFMFTVVVIAALFLMIIFSLSNNR